MVDILYLLDGLDKLDNLFNKVHVILKDVLERLNILLKGDIFFSLDIWPKESILSNVDVHLKRMVYLMKLLSHKGVLSHMHPLLFVDVIKTHDIMCCKIDMRNGKVRF